ncbi:UNVERIFIED_CONTAM: Transcription elongation factor TFIIS [Sesamum calycinum]|uniref:Transcription elongation factor n=1 Tax=Sesamum calycinum TaxID=2727403 RepID=A0AAW2LRH8_9LAMI
MEKELTELFESVKRAADAAENSPGEEDRCLDALKRLKKFPVNYQVLVSTQVGKRLRQLTKHRSDKIKMLASDVVDIWKNIIVKETMKNKKNGTVDNGDSVKAEPSGRETNELKSFQRTDSVKHEQISGAKKLKVERTTHSSTSNSNKPVKLETSSSVKVEKVEVVQTTKHASGEYLQVEKKVKVEKASSGARASDPVGPPKLTSLVSCKDPLRDKVREILAEALCKVSGEVDDDDLKDRVNRSDPYRVAVLVETAMFEKWGKSNGAQKFKYRSIMFNIKDQNNPDFRRKVLLGDFEPRAILELTPEEMASDARQMENEKLKQKAMFNSERAAAPKASTNEFTCGRCKKKETTYYQMQTRSADEPMTTFVTCVNCGNHWKFC